MRLQFLAMTLNENTMLIKITRRNSIKRGLVGLAAACLSNPSRVQALPSHVSMGDLRVRVLDAKVQFAEQKFKQPLIISSGAISNITEAVVEVGASVAGREAIGRGSMYLSDLWAWPDPALSHDVRDARLRTLCTSIAGKLWELCGGEPVHPTELGLRLHEKVCRGSSPPPLARAMCASPFDIAIHDAVGIALGRSSFALYDDSLALPSADPFFKAGSAASAIRKMIRPPKQRLKAWYLVGKKDDIRRDIGPWVKDRGYRCFKIKLLGHDNNEDVARTVEVFRGVKQLGVDNPLIEVDTNEANPDAQSVRDYYIRLKETDAEAFAALQYFEQPTARDIITRRYDWRSIARYKPVLLDEGLRTLELMEEAKKQGWSGFALKTCKGHSFILVAAAWARQNGMLVSLQDLTNPGLALIHAALFAAHVPTINDVELNSPQFTPSANLPWLPKYKTLFAPHNGYHILPNIIPSGLGSTM